jgi:hypothetical protein
VQRVIEQGPSQDRLSSKKEPGGADHHRAPPAMLPFLSLSLGHVISLSCFRFGCCTKENECVQVVINTWLFLDEILILFRSIFMLV